MKSKICLLAIVAHAALPVLSHTMVDGTAKISIDTRIGDLSVESSWYKDSDFNLRLSTRWGEGDSGILKINGVETKTLGALTETDFSLTLKANVATTYDCEFTIGDMIYSRTVHTTGAKKLCGSNPIVYNSVLNPEGLRGAESLDAIVLSWDASWIGGDSDATVVIADNGVEVKNATGAGEFVHTPSGKGVHEFTYITYINDVAQEEKYSATLCFDAYNVTFDANGGLGGKTVVQNYGSVIDVPDVTRVGYNLSGWLPEVDVTVPAYDVTYIAQWTPKKYRITFNSNGGVGGRSENMDYGAEIIAPEVSRVGYMFSDWSPRVDVTVPANDVTYTAQWTPIKYSVTFDANGGSGGASFKQDCGSTIYKPEVLRVGYTFKGWSPSVDTTVPANDVTYTAQWEISKYTVMFDANGGDGGWSEAREHGSAIAAPEVSRVGYQFKGWAPSVAETVPAHDVTYVAQWAPNKYNVTFDANGGIGGWSEEREYGATITAPTVVRDGYVFDGWLPAVSSTVSTSDVTYVAQWKEVEGEPEEPGDPGESGGISFGDTYSYVKESWVNDGTYDSSLVKSESLAVFTGDPAWPVAWSGKVFIEVRGAKSKADLSPVVEKLSTTETLIAAVISDEEFRAMVMPPLSTKGKWQAAYNLVDRRSAGDFSGSPNFQYQQISYEYDADDGSWYMWPLDLWPSNKADGDRFWIAVDVIPTPYSGHWYGISNFRVWQEGTNIKSDVVYLTYRTTDAWPLTKDPMGLFHGISTIESSAMCLEKSCGPHYVAYNTVYNSYWMESLPLSVTLPDAGILYIDHAWAGDLEEKQFMGADSENLSYWGLRENTEEEFHRGGLATGATNPGSLKVYIGSAKTITICDEDDEDGDLDFTRLQFFPASSKAVAIEASYVSLLKYRCYPLNNYDSCIGDYLQGYVTGTGVYKTGETVQLTAHPAPGEEFDHWEFKYGEFPEGIATNQQTLSFVVTDACAGTAEERKQMVVKAVWKEKREVVATPDYISRGNVTGSGLYHDGVQATLVATANGGYSFVRWSDGVITPTRTITVSGDAEYVAEFGCLHAVSTSVVDGQEPTCTKEGRTQAIVCDICGEIIEGGESIPALGHQMGEDVVTKAATAEEFGEKTYYCARCGKALKVELIEKLPRPEIRDVTAKQRYPWNGKVDISYTVVGDIAAAYPSKNVALHITATDRMTGESYAAESSAISGDVGNEECSHHVVWDLDSQGVAFASDDIVFSVAYCTSKTVTRCYCESESGFVDSQIATLVDSQYICYDSSWVGGNADATVVILDNGEEVRRETGIGGFEHELTGMGRHDLTYKTLISGVEQEEVYTATFFKDWKYEVDEGGNAKILETSQTDGIVRIPSELDGYPVRYVSDKVFYCMTSLTDVIIPDSVTNIGSKAFYGCDGLRSVIIPHSVTRIGDYAFAWCGSLSEITIPKTVTSIGANTFYGCGDKVTIAFCGLPPNDLSGSGLLAGGEKIKYRKSYAKIYELMVSEWNFGGYLFLEPSDYAGMDDESWAADSAVCDSEVSHDGYGSLRIDGVGINSEVSVNLKVNGSGRLSFWWKASSECDMETGNVYDYGYVSVDGEVLGSLSEAYKLSGCAIGGSTDWTSDHVDITGEGEHIVVWTYKKDDYDEMIGIEDCIWLDDVKWVPMVSARFDLGGGEGVAPSIIAELAGETVILPTDTNFGREDYVFDPLGLCFALKKLQQPLPPSPAVTCIFALSTNIIFTVQQTRLVFF